MASNQSKTVLDYYNVLQIPWDAPPEVINSAFRTATRLWHPDRHSDSDTTEVCHFIRFTTRLRWLHTLNKGKRDASQLH